ncbi:MAG TPA: DUF5916 domain-containing protein [Anaeromyxobacteraceae bacterium]|nr:DUF5916 domain-containing protein [Anaeromyxobacteraceae bacterium]
MRSSFGPLVLAALAAAPFAAGAAAPGDPLTAVRRTGAIAVDGRLDESDWRGAPVFDGFTQHFPIEGAAPSNPTEVRVLHDDRTLYVGVRCADAAPGGIVKAMGRRDDAPKSDLVLVAIDSMNDRRMAYVFVVTAAGVQEDAILFDDDRMSKDWDAVWEGAASNGGHGWEAELAIPLSALRFSNAPVQTWGMGVKRVIQRAHEDLLSFRQPRSARGSVRYLNPLVGLSDLAPTRELSISPYTAARVAIRPEDEDDLALGRVTDPIADFGLDLRTGIGRGLTLQGTFNPDFGQVEADQLIQNLSTYELFFPEKRPFFTEGMDLFEPVAPANRRAPFQLFYSRRIGLDAPILGAAKLTGKAIGDLQVGVLEAVVTGDGFGGGEGRRLRWARSQPLHLGPADALPSLEPARRNFFTGVARWQPGPTRSFGATIASALPLESACTQAEVDLADANDDDWPAKCEANVGNAAGFDWSVRSPDQEWFFLGQTAASHALGGAPRRTLADGTVLERGDLGYGGYLAAGKHAGEPWRFEVHYEHASPRLQLNSVGFQRTQNEAVARGILRFTRPQGGGPFHEYILFGGTEGRWTTDGRGLLRGQQFWGGFEAQLRSFHWFGCTGWRNAAAWDVREISESGIAYGRPMDVGGECFVSTDGGRPILFEGAFEWGRAVAAGPVPSASGWTAVGLVAVRPHPRVETRVELRYGEDRHQARHLDDDGSTILLADLFTPSASVLVRQQVVLTPKLTLQAYGQLFSSYGRYGPYYRAPAGGDRVEMEDLEPGFAGFTLDGAAVTGDQLAAEYDFRDVALNLNFVARWEYRLGSTVYLVYTRAQAEPEPTGIPSRAIGPHALAQGPTTDTVLVKWSYFFTR